MKHSKSDVNATYRVDEAFEIGITNDTVAVVTINGKNYTVVGGKVIILADELAAGHYIVTATIYESDKYVGNVTSKEFDIIKNDEEIVSVVANDTVMFGNETTIVVTMANVTDGTVIIEVNGVNYTVAIINKVATLSVALPVGKYNATAYFLGDYKYNKVNKTSAEFEVVNQTVPSVVINAPATVEVENDLEFTVTYTGNATLVVKVNGKVITPTGDKYVVRMNATGNYTITAEAEANNYYYAASDDAVVSVYKHAAEIANVEVPSVDTLVGNDVTIKVTMGNVSSGKVLIEVAGHNYTVDINSNVAELTVALPVGNYTAKAYFLGDDKYNATELANATVFEVYGKQNATVEIIAGTVVEIENNFTFTVTNSTPVVVTVNGKVIPLKDGKYTFEATTAGEYEIIAMM